MLRSLSDMKNHQLIARDGQLGGVEDFLYDEIDTSIRFLVVNTGNWLTGRKVLVSPVAIEEVDGSTQTLSIDLTREQIEKGPSIEAAEPVSRKLEKRLALHYGWPAPLQAPLQPAVPVGVPRPSGEQRQPNPESTVPAANRTTPTEPEELQSGRLRSVNEVIGYHIQATDGEIGHVDEFIADDENWIIRWFVVDTRNWLPGRKVLVSPDWVTRTSWGDRDVHVDVTRTRIQDCPEYNPELPVNQRYERQLYDYYGRPVYWDHEGRTTPTR